MYRLATMGVPQSLNLGDFNIFLEGVAMERRFNGSELGLLQREARVRQQLVEVVLSGSHTGLSASISVLCPLRNVNVDRCEEAIRFCDLRLGFFQLTSSQGFFLYADRRLRQYNDPWPHGACQQCGTSVELVVNLAQALTKSAVVDEYAAACAQSLARRTG